MSPHRYFRLESPTQTKQDAILQTQSREVWGREARGSHLLCVKAYRGSLRLDQRGIDFTTTILPERGAGTPYEARWYYPQTPGTMLRTRDNLDYSAIPAEVINRQP
jgi:hypothetical protein